MIPVLSKGMKIDDVPAHYKWVTLLSADEPNHVGKLWNVMSGIENYKSQQMGQGVLRKNVNECINLLL